MNKQNNIKRLVHVIALITMVSVTQNVQAQLLKTSLGLELAVMKGDFKNIASFGIGTSGELELALTEKFGLTAQIGYLYLSPDDMYKSAFMMPIQLGFKLYTNSKEEGVYIQPKVGVHKVSTTKPSFVILGTEIPEQTYSFTSMSYGFGFGYMTGGKINIELRYNLVSNNGEGTMDYIGMRVAYNFL